MLRAWGDLVTQRRGRWAWGPWAQKPRVKEGKKRKGTFQTIDTETTGQCTIQNSNKEKKEIRENIMMFPSSPPGVTAMGDNDPDSQLEICDVI